MKRLHWIALAVAFHLYLRLPNDWRLTWWLLPYAGQYAHTKDFAEHLALSAIEEG